MNIGFDATRADPHYVGGVNTYLLGLLRGLLNISGTHRVQLYVSHKNAHIFQEFSDHPVIDFIVFPTNPKEEWLRRSLAYLSGYSGSPRFHKNIANHLFKDWVRFVEDRSDVVYIPTTTLFPYQFRKPTIVSMHDIQQVHFPQFFSNRERLQRKIKFGLTAEFATKIQASSQFIKQDLLSHFKDLTPAQICVISEGVSIEEFSKPRNVDVISKYSIPPDFLFFPAQLWPHKNHMTVLKALERLQRNSKKTIPLVLTGAKFSAADAIFAFIKEHDLKKVRYLGKVPFDDLVALYQKARYFITAVLYESSSLPFLEAAAAGCATIVSDTPPNREISKILATQLFDPLDDKALAELLARIWDDDSVRKSQAEHNRIAVEHYRWENVAKGYMKVFESLTQN